MAPRRRERGRESWPAGLRCRDGYYSWVNPRTGKEHGIGRDKALAIAQATEANLHAAGLLEHERLLDRVRGVSRQTLGRWLDRYDEELKKRHQRGKLAATTLKMYLSQSRITRRELGADVAIATITPLIVAEKLKEIADSGREAAARQLRSFMKDAFRAAVVDGWLDENPVRETRVERGPVKRARLTWEVFQKVYERTESRWLRNAMALALLTAQRRQTIASARFSDFRDGAWWVVQGKTDAHVAIPLDLRLDVFGMSLDDVVRQCRSTGVLSRYLVHQTVRRGRSPVGNPLDLETISASFAGEVAALELDWGGKNPPSFHEIRSLSGRLYHAQGNVNVQELMGHRDPETTRLYEDARGAEWVRVTVKRGA